jgi:hypothetical protein
VACQIRSLATLPDFLLADLCKIAPPDAQWALDPYRWLCLRPDDEKRALDLVDRQLLTRAREQDAAALAEIL